MKQLVTTHRQNIALALILDIKQITPINNNARDLVKIGDSAEGIKLQGVTDEGINVYIEIELIGDPALLKKYRFEIGKHAGFVLRAID
jgi:hypothetical protein